MSSANDPPISSSIPSHPPSAVTSSSSISRDSIVLLTLPVSTKLTRHNFLAWKSQIVPLLHGYRLHKYLDSAPPAEKIELDGQLQDNSAFDHWIQQDQLILGWLPSSLSETILGEVVSCTSSSDLWRALQQSFSATSRSRLLELRRNLQTKTKGGLTCSDYFSQMPAISDELAFIGSAVPEEDLVLYILGGLRADSNSFVTTITARQGGTSLPELQSLLLTHEKMLSNQVSSVLSSSSTPTTYFTQLRPGSRPSYSNQGYKPTNNSRSGYNPRPVNKPSYNPRPSNFSSQALLPTPH